MERHNQCLAAQMCAHRQLHAPSPRVRLPTAQLLHGALAARHMGQASLPAAPRLGAVVVVVVQTGEVRRGHQGMRQLDAGTLATGLRARCQITDGQAQPLWLIPSVPAGNARLAPGPRLQDTSVAEVAGQHALQR